MPSRRKSRPPVSGSAKSEQKATAITVESAIEINSPVETAFRFWRDLANAPRFMPQVKSAAAIDDRRSHWVASVGGMDFEWDAEVTRTVENELIEWSSLHGKKTDHTGAVHFSPAGRGTRVRTVITFQPAGAIAATLQSMARNRLQQQVEKSLERFRELVESSDRDERGG